MCIPPYPDLYLLAKPKGSSAIDKRQRRFTTKAQGRAAPHRTTQVFGVAAFCYRW